MKNIIGNLYGGIVAAIIALPLALAFGIASGLGASAGIYGAIIVGFFASALGGTKTQISGPTGPMTVVVVSILPAFSHNLALLFGTFFLAGLFQIVFGLLKVGSLVRYVPYPVISGFMNGVGVIIVLLQLAVAFGVESSSSVVQAIINLPSVIGHLNIESFLLALGAIIIIRFTPSWVKKRVPSSLIALVLLSALSVMMHLDVSYVANVNATLPIFTMVDISFKNLSFMLTSAITLAILGSIDTLLTSLVADSLTNTKHNSNRELIAQGIGNSVASFFGALPGAGATMRTVVNINNGGSNQLSGVIHSLFLLLILLVLAPLTAYIPLPVLAGVLIMVGLDILDYRLIKQLKYAPKYDLIVMLSVFVLTVFVDLIVAVGVGVMLASFLIIHRLSREIDIISNEEDSQDVYTQQGIHIINIKGAFFFGSTSEIINRIEKTFDKKAVIIDCSAVPFMDLSAIYALSDALSNIAKSDAHAYLVVDEKRKNKWLCAH